jgi:hypothetical protein
LTVIFKGKNLGKKSGKQKMSEKSFIADEMFVFHEAFTPTSNMKT